jgi:(4S)-4-hydroxy-5-phosphonooxypentane-2,3-dione isomerase
MWSVDLIKHTVIRFRSSELAKIILQGFIVVPNSDLEIVKRELVTHKRLTLKEPGCLTFTVTQDEINHHKFSVYEEFVNQDAFDNHQARVKSSKWGEVTRNVERHYQISSSE